MPEPSSASEAAVAIDITVEAEGWPEEVSLRRMAEEAVTAALAATGSGGGHTLGVLFTGDGEVRALNARFRDKDAPTNVLSFPAPPGVPVPGQPPHLGDIALALETVAREADAEGKKLDHHVTHLLVHGFLHLVGYDHETPAEAEEMEALERRILEGLAIGDPYA